MLINIMKLIYIFLLLLIPIYSSYKTLLKFSRVTLPNRIIQDKLRPMIKLALNKYNLTDYNISEFVSIDINPQKNVDLINVKLFIVKKTVGWNTIEKLVEIIGSKKNNKFYIKSLSHVNSDDLGKIIPDNSSIFQNNLFKTRNWDIQKQKWNQLEKNWDVTWSDKII